MFSILIANSIVIVHGCQSVALFIDSISSPRIISEEAEESKCGLNECWCMSSGGNTCGYSTNEACDPDECSDRDECPGYGYWCKDAAIAKCYCEFKNKGANNNGIMCDTTDGSSRLFGSCDVDQPCTGDETEDYENRKSKLCEGGSNNSYQQEGESCGMGVVKNRGQCRKDLECIFGAMELVGTCQVKKQQADCRAFNDEGFAVVLGSICKGRTIKELNDVFDVQFQEENVSNCQRFCNCQKDCKGFNFNPNSNNRKCSWKSDSPIETFTNTGIQNSGQSCVIKESGRNCTDCIEEFVEAGMCAVCSNVDECFVFLPEGCNHCGNAVYEHCNAEGIKEGQACGCDMTDNCLGDCDPSLFCLFEEESLGHGTCTKT